MRAITFNLSIEIVGRFLVGDYASKPVKCLCHSLPLCFSCNWNYSFFRAGFVSWRNLYSFSVYSIYDSWQIFLSSGNILPAGPPFHVCDLLPTMPSFYLLVFQFERCKNSVILFVRLLSYFDSRLSVSFVCAQRRPLCVSSLCVSSSFRLFPSQLR